MKLINTTGIDETVVKRSSVLNLIITVSVYLLGLTLPNVKGIFFSDFILGICLTYFTDIVFVQNFFKIGDTIQKISYNNYLFRLKYLFNPSVIYKFLVVITIGSIINRSIHIFIINLMKKYNILQYEKYKDYITLVLNLVINFFITIMFLNYIKFKWAYVDNDDVYLTIIILSLFSLSILISTK
jgi:hypothetical protein